MRYHVKNLHFHINGASIMARVRKIKRNPSEKIAYVIDTNFLVNKFIPPNCVTDATEKTAIQNSLDWWIEVEAQVKAGKAIIYVPDICIAESFKVLSKKYYKHKYFKYPIDYKRARDGLAGFLKTPVNVLRAAKRHIKVHDVPTSRDLIISVDRFNELYHKHGKNVSVVDLLILATAKYLMDFYAIPKARMNIVTLDNALWEGSKKVQEIPNAYHPGKPSDHASKVFE
jgi:predicted nucleic acid-binding protein